MGGRAAQPRGPHQQMWGPAFIFFYLNPPLYIPTNFKIFPPLSGLQPLYYFLYFHFFLPFSGPSTGSRLRRMRSVPRWAEITLHGEAVGAGSPSRGGDAHLIWDVSLSPQDPMELCGQLGLCSSASALPLHTLLTEKVTQVLSTLGVSRDPPPQAPDSSMHLRIQTNSRKGELNFAYFFFFSLSISIFPRWGMSFVGD